MGCREILLCLVLFGFASMAHADFSLSPGVDLRLEYNDNLYLEETNEEDDLITIITPNLGLNWETSRLDVSMNASISMEKYLDNTEEDRIGADAAQASTLDALARIYRQSFFVRINDTYQRVPIDEGGRGGEANRNINLTDSNQFRFNPYLTFEPIKSTRVNLSYTYENLWYEADDADDATRHIHTAKITRELSARISIFLSGEYTQYRPKNPASVRLINEGGEYDFDRENASVGVSYRPSSRLQLNAQYGHTWLDYAVLSDSDSETWSAGIDYELTSKYTAGVQYSVDYVVSVEDGPSERDYLSAYLAYEERYGVEFSVFFSSRDYLEIDRSTDSYGAELSGDLPFNEKVGVTGLFRYTHFEDTGIEPALIAIIGDNGIQIIDVFDSLAFLPEEYDRYSTRFSLYYETRLGRVAAGHIYNLNESDLENADYANNIVFLEASFKF